MTSPDFEYEKSLIPTACRFLMGVDEVGRGPWAGPVTVGAFIIDLNTFNPETFVKLKVRDSKTLSPSQRQNIFSEFQKQGYKYQTFSASSFIIDRQGIGHAIENLILDALTFFHGQYDFCLLDGNFNSSLFNDDPDSPRLKSVINGDAACFSIAAASICAKEVRDTEMNQLDLLYPQYDFKNNKGYGTKTHQLALSTHGPTPVHRLSYKPLQNLATQI